MSVSSVQNGSIGRLSAVRAAQGTTLQQIATGRRITQAAIDPAGAAIVAELDAESASQRVSIRNANDGLSVLQTADGAASSTVDQLQRIRELAMQASSGTLSDSQRSLIQREVDELVEQMDAQAEGTEFNGLELTDGSRASLDVQTGTGSGDQTSISMMDLRTSTLGVDGLDLTSAAGAQAALDAVDGALDEVNSGRSELGASHNRLASSIAYGEDSLVQTQAAASRIGDTDFAETLLANANQALQNEANVFAVAQARNVSRVAVLGLLG